MYRIFRYLGITQCTILMASSDEEGEILPQYITNYEFVDNNNLPVSLAILPIQWNENDEVVGDSSTQVFVRGTWDSGLQKIYKHVVAWKFELSYALPEISVLTKDKNWVMLQEPRKCFQQVIRKILITVHWLHYVKKNHNACEKSVWNHVARASSCYEPVPSEVDLLDYRPLIGEAARRDKDIATSENFLTLFGKPQIYSAVDEDCREAKLSDFIADGEDDEIGDDGKEGADDDDSIFDTVCAICDNGGEILCCNGRCLRSFHATVADGEDSNCASLGYSNHDEVEAIKYFLCKNCLYKQHQCFACGRLGSSARSPHQEVFPCASATCGHFYHPKCVAKLLHIRNEAQTQLEGKIAAGESFTCPAHKCFVCKKGEDENVNDLQFAMCRRCPKAYHRKCLPWSIIYGYDSDGVHIQRAWGDLLPNQRILIYCMDHEIDRILKTPVRNHLIFPDFERKKKHTTELQSSGKMDLLSKRNIVSEPFPTNGIPAKKLKQKEKLLDGGETGDATTYIEMRYPRQDFQALKKPIMINAGRKPVKNNNTSVFGWSSTADKSKSPSGKISLVNLPSFLLEHKEQIATSSKPENEVLNKSSKKEGKNSRPLVDPEMQKRILALMDEVTSSFDVEDFNKRYNVHNAKACNSTNALDKSLTLGLVEKSVEAVRTAFQTIEEGGSIEDAKAICKPETLKRIFGWKTKLRVYLAPFIHGSRYTSFGRHFTKVEKLKEIVHRLHQYVQEGDTIVDFSCGSNDFSCLMKEKLDETGKQCSFKNYDLIQPKNDFCFEKRDWMSVGLDELPDGCQLILGLNPPFGVAAVLANAFIEKALQFRPKLIILIVPKEAKRLDKIAPYNLIWQDDKVLSGKSFYLPGSVDVNDKQLDDWNINPPPLYLWSRADWTAKHVAIAADCGHVNREQYGFPHLTEKDRACSGDFSSNAYACGDTHGMLATLPKYFSGIGPEIIRQSVPGDHSDGYFRRYGTSEDSTIGRGENQSLGDPHGMQYEGKCQGPWPIAEGNEALAFEANDMCIEPELSAAMISPNMWTDMDIESILETDPPETP